MIICNGASRQHYVGFKVRGSCARSCRVKERHLISERSLKWGGQNGAPASDILQPDQLFGQPLELLEGRPGLTGGTCLLSPIVWYQAYPGTPLLAGI